MFDTVIGNACVLTLTPGASPIFPGFVAVQGSTIKAVDQACRPAELPPAREYLDVQGALVMPGLVNTHCHAPMVWFRGLADDLPLQEWLTQKIFPAEGAWLDPDKTFWGTLLAAAEMIRGGITTVADGYFYEGEVRRALAQAGLRAVAAQGLVDFPFPGVPDPRDGLACAEAFLDSGDDFAPPHYLRGFLPLPLHLRARNPAGGQGPNPESRGSPVHPSGGDQAGGGGTQVQNRAGTSGLSG